jgi:hypothetical protein
MSRSTEAVQSPEPTRCPGCGGLYYPPNEDGCSICRRRRRVSSRAEATVTNIGDPELREEAEAAAYYFLESFWGHPDD